jgi:hypothetical protein
MQKTTGRKNAIHLIYYVVSMIAQTYILYCLHVYFFAAMFIHGLASAKRLPAKDRFFGDPSIVLMLMLIFVSCMIMQSKLFAIGRRQESIIVSIYAMGVSTVFVFISYPIDWIVWIVGVLRLGIRG